jgi:hypothetical protein
MLAPTGHRASGGNTLADGSMAPDISRQHLGRRIDDSTAPRRTNANWLNGPIVRPPHAPLPSANPFPLAHRIFLRPLYGLVAVLARAS